MISMSILLDGDGAWPDLKGKTVIHLANESPTIQVAVLDHGTTSGKPSVAFRIDLPDGKVVVAETTARLFVAAGQAILGKYPELMD